MLAKVVPDETERRWIEPAMLTLLGISDGDGAADELFAAWRTFFDRLAATGPVVLVFEDLHWADPGLLDFIDHLLEWSREQPIYVLTLARPELLERRSDWGAGRRNFLSLGLEPLSRGGDARASGRPRARPAEGRPPTRSWRAPTACRSTRSRRSGCSSPTAGCARRHGAYALVGDLTAPRRSRDAHGAHRGPPGRPRPGGPGPAPGRRRPRPELHPGRPRRGLRSGCRRHRDSSRRASPSARSCPHGRTRGRPSEASTRSSRPSSGRSPTTRSRSAIGESVTLPRPASSRPSGLDELAGALAGHYLAAHANSPAGPGGGRPRDPGPDRAHRGRRSRGGARLAGPGARLPRAGAHDRGGRRTPAGAPRAGRCRGHGRGPVRPNRGARPHRPEAQFAARGDRLGEARVISLQARALASLLRTAEAKAILIETVPAVRRHRRFAGAREPRAPTRQRLLDRRRARGGGRVGRQGPRGGRAPRLRRAASSTG